MFINKSDKEFILYQESLKNMYIPKENEINPEHIKLELSNLIKYAKKKGVHVCDLSNEEKTIFMKK